MNFKGVFYSSLRDLLATEEAQYLAEAASSRESLSERIGKMRQKAKRIREEKESEHAKLVQEKYDQRFRRDCAELRELQSKELDYELGNEHLWQMQEKFDRKKDQQVGFISFQFTSIRIEYMILS